MSIQTYLCLFAKVFTRKIDDINSSSKFFYVEYIFLSPYMLLAWVPESANKVISCLHGFSIQSGAGKCNEVNLSEIRLALKYHKILVVFKAAYPDVQKWECQITQSGISKRLCYSDYFHISGQLRCKFSTYVSIIWVCDGLSIATTQPCGVPIPHPFSWKQDRYQ